MRRRIGIVLLLAGSAALVWCLTVLGGAALYQKFANWRLNRTIQTAASEPAASPEASHPAPKLYDLVGRLEIPRLHISTVILEGDDEHCLRYGAGHVPGTSLPYQAGNVAIAAHRDTFFRPLRKIEPLDRIRLTTPGGSYDYIVESTEVVPPDDVGVLRSSARSELTLITCYPFYFVGPAPKRFIVHARRVHL